MKAGPKMKNPLWESFIANAPKLSFQFVKEKYVDFQAQYIKTKS